MSLFTEEQKVFLDGAKVLQFAEIIKFTIDVSHKIKEAKSDDGKVGKFEALGIAASESIDAFTAASGASDAWLEIKALDPEDIPILGNILFPELKDYPSAQRERILDSQDALRALLKVYRTFTTPPKAKVLPEDVTA